MEKIFDEIENDPYSKRIGTEHVVVNGDLIIGQAGNGHIHVYDKNTGRMIMHVNCSKMYSDDELVKTVSKLIRTVDSHEAV